MRQYTPEEQAARGRRAAELLSDEVVQDALTAAEESYIVEWKTARSVEERELAWAKVQALLAVALQLRGIESDGLVAEHALGRRG